MKAKKLKRKYLWVYFYADDHFYHCKRKGQPKYKKEDGEMIKTCLVYGIDGWMVEISWNQKGKHWEFMDGYASEIMAVTKK